MDRRYNAEKYGKQDSSRQRGAKRPLISIPVLQGLYRCNHYISIGSHHTRIKHLRKHFGPTILTWGRGGVFREDFDDRWMWAEDIPQYNSPETTNQKRIWDFRLSTWALVLKYIHEGRKCQSQQHEGCSRAPGVLCASLIWLGDDYHGSILQITRNSDKAFDTASRQICPFDACLVKPRRLDCQDTFKRTHNRTISRALVGRTFLPSLSYSNGMDINPNQVNRLSMLFSSARENDWTEVDVDDLHKRTFE